MTSRAVPAPLDAPTFSAAEPEVSNQTSSTNCRRSLRERRSGSRAGLGLDMETITSSSRESDANKESASLFRGWEITAHAFKALSCSTKEEALGRLLDPTQQNPSAIRVMCYNILAARYTSSDKYVHCPVWALNEPYRLKNIASEIRGANPDILVLEECSTAALDSADLGGQLQQLGYLWKHVVITTDTKERQTSDSGTSGNWTTSDRPEFEGVAIAYRADRFTLAEHVPLKLNTMAQRDAGLRAEEKRRVIVSSHNVANIVVLQDAATNGHLVLGGIHGFWDHAKPECQVYQQVRVIDELERIASMFEELGAVSVFYCGDFNCEPHGPAVMYICRGDARSTGTRLFEANESAAHGLKFASAYEGYRGAAAGHVTACGGAFSGIIDHIFYQPEQYSCVAVARLAPAAEIPNTAVPSDHYPVCAWFVPTAADLCL